MKLADGMSLGSYIRDVEQTIADIKIGELYLFSGGLCRKHILLI